MEVARVEVPTAAGPASTLSQYAAPTRVDYKWLPADGSVLEGLRCNRRVQRLKAGRLPLTYPPRDALDEYPLVPFLFGDDGSNLYDSTAIAEWLDEHDGRETRRLIPRDPACELVARLIDDHFDDLCDPELLLRCRLL